MASSIRNSGGNVSSLQEELLCSICLDLYDEPVSLPCLHSFCLKCIRIKVERDTAQIRPLGVVAVICPTCRKNFMMPSVNDLRKNFNLANIVEKYTQVIGLQKILCPSHKQDVGLFCEDCEALMCFSCFNDHKGHKIEDTQKVWEKYKSKMERKLLPGLSMKQTQQEEAHNHWENIINTEKKGKAERNRHFTRELVAMKVMLQTSLLEKVKDMQSYSQRVTDQLIEQCQGKKNIINGDLSQVKKIVKDIVTDTDPAKILQTYTKITKNGDLDVEKIPDCAKNLPPNSIQMKIDPKWRKKLQEFCDSVTLITSGVEEDDTNQPTCPLDDGEIYSLKTLPCDVKVTEKEEIVIVYIPITEVTTLDCMFDKSEIIVQFKTVNDEFLKHREVTKRETKFEWKLKLRHEISPVKSKSSKTEEGILITLAKSKKEPWDLTTINTSNTDQVSTLMSADPNSTIPSTSGSIADTVSFPNCSYGNLPKQSSSGSTSDTVSFPNCAKGNLPIQSSNGSSADTVSLLHSVKGNSSLSSNGGLSIPVNTESEDHLNIQEDSDLTINVQAFNPFNKEEDTQRSFSSEIKQADPTEVQVLGLTDPSDLTLDPGCSTQSTTLQHVFNSAIAEPGYKQGDPMLSEIEAMNDDTQFLVNDCQNGTGNNAVNVETGRRRKFSFHEISKGGKKIRKMNCSSDEDDNEEIKTVIEDLVQKEEIEKFIVEKIAELYPGRDLRISTAEIRSTVQKIWCTDDEDFK